MASLRRIVADQEHSRLSRSFSRLCSAECERAVDQCQTVSRVTATSEKPHNITEPPQAAHHGTQPVHLGGGLYLRARERTENRPSVNDANAMTSAPSP